MAFGERHLFSWLHLSDLHFGHGGAGTGWDQTRVLDLLKRDALAAAGSWPELPPIDAIMVTGDVAFSGGMRNASEYQNAATWLQELAANLGVPDDRVFIVAGNHDVQRAPKGQPLHPLVQQVRDGRTTLDELLNDNALRADLLARQANFTAFNQAFGARNTESWVVPIQLPDLGTLSLVGLNTALLSADDGDQGQLHLAHRHRALLSQSDLTMLLTHHPDQDGWLADEDAVQRVVRNQAFIHLSGHTHDPRLEGSSNTGSTTHVRLVAAAAHTDPSEPESHGYNFASLMVRPDGSLAVRSWPRRWYPHWDGFRVDHFGVRDRSFWDEKLLDRQMKGSGLALEPPAKLRLTGVHWWGNPPVHWKELLAGRRRLEVFGVSVGTLFDDANLGHVRDFLNAGNAVEVVIADPRNKTAMARYDEDFAKPLGDRSKKVAQTIERLWGLRQSLRVPARLTVRLLDLTFKYSAYRLDGEVLFVPYAMTPGKRTPQTPALVAREGGTWLTEFLGPDLDALLNLSEELTEATVKQIRDST